MQHVGGPRLWLWANLGGSTGGVPSDSRAGFLMESAKWLVELCPCWILSPGCYALNLSLPLSYADHLCILQGVRSVCPQEFHTELRKLGTHSHVLTFLCRRHHRPCVSLLALSCWGWGDRWCGSFPLTLFNVSNLSSIIFSLLQWYRITPPLDSWVPERYSHLCAIIKISIL